MFIFVQNLKTLIMKKRKYSKILQVLVEPEMFSNLEAISTYNNESIAEFVREAISMKIEEDKYFFCDWCGAIKQHAKDEACVDCMEGRE